MSLYIYLFVLFAPRVFSPLLKNQNLEIIFPVWSGIWSILFQEFFPTGMGRREPWGRCIKQEYSPSSPGMRGCSENKTKSVSSSKDEVWKLQSAFSLESSVYFFSKSTGSCQWNKKKPFKNSQEFLGFSGAFVNLLKEISSGVPSNYHDNNEHLFINLFIYLLSYIIIYLKYFCGQIHRSSRRPGGEHV